MGNIESPVLCTGKQGPVEELYNYKFGKTVDINNTDDIIKNIEGVVYNIAPIKQPLEISPYFIHEINRCENTPIWDEYMSKVMSEVMSGERIKPTNFLYYPPEVIQELTQYRYGDMDSLWERMKSKAAPPADRGEGMDFLYDTVLSSPTGILNLFKQDGETPERIDTDTYIKCQIHQQFNYKKNISVESNLEVIMSSRCPIPIELLICYYQNLQQYKQVKIIIDQLRIIIDDEKIKFKYQDFRMVIPLIRRLSRGLFPNLHDAFTRNMYKIHSGEDVRQNPNFKVVVSQFFSHYVYHPLELAEILTKTWAIKCEKPELPPFVFVPFHENLDQLITFNLALSNTILSAEEYQNILNRITPVEFDKFVIRPRKSTILLNQKYFVIECQLIGNNIYEDSSVFNQANSDLNFDNLSINGLSHIYRHVFTVFKTAIGTQQDREKLLNKFGVTTYEEIINILDAI